MKALDVVNMEMSTSHALFSSAQKLLWLELSKVSFLHKIS